MSKKPKGYWNNFENCKNEALKYKTRNQFYTNNESAYDAAKRNNWLDIFFKHNYGLEIQKQINYWNNYERCYEEAKKYRTRGEFKRKKGIAYKSAKRNKWLDDYEWFIFKPNGYWTYEHCYEEAKKYNTLTNFKKYGKGAYIYAHKNKWIKDYSWFKENIWTYERCYEEAKKYETKNDFKKNCNEAFILAKRSKWLDKYEWLFNNRKPSGYWTYERCYEEAKKYETKTEFYKFSNGAYDRAKRKKWLDDYTWLKNKNIDLCNGKIDSIYAYEFNEQHAVYVGRTLMILQKQRDWQHIFNNDSVSSFAKKQNIAIPKMKILEDKLTLAEGVIKEGEWLEKYKINGWIILNKAKTGSIGSLAKKIWTKEECYETAKKYKLMKDFHNHNEGAYNMAKANNWLKEYTWFRQHKPKGYWTYERCYEEAKKYKFLKDFRKYVYAAYNYALRHKWLEDYTWLKQLQTQKPSGYWGNQEHCYEEAKKYKFLKDFRKCGKCAYNSALKNGWLGDYKWLIDNRKPKGYWTKENCKNEALKYETRKEFAVNNSSAYSYAYKNKWLDDFFPKKTKLVKPKGHWTYERCYEEAKKYNTVTNFKKYSKGAYKHAYEYNWLDDYEWFIYRKKRQLKIANKREVNKIGQLCIM